jgi:hypothetical protein
MEAFTLLLWLVRVRDTVSGCLAFGYGQRLIG